MTQTELAWAAGLFDGEGWSCTGKSAKRKYQQIIMGIGNTNIDLLKRFQSAVGCGVISGNKPTGLGKKIVYQLKINGPHKFDAAVSLLLPYISQEKLQQASAAWEKWSNARILRGGLRKDNWPYVNADCVRRTQR